MVISKVLDSTHYVLSDLQGRILIGVYHINRLKTAKVRTPSGIVSIYTQLCDTFHHISQQEAKEATPLPDVSPAVLLQSMYDLPIHHHLQPAACDCILDAVPLY